MGHGIGHLLFAARRLRRTPAFSLAATTLLGVAMAIAAATATLVNAALFKEPELERRLTHIAYYPASSILPDPVVARVLDDPPDSFAQLAGFGVTRVTAAVALGTSHRSTVEAVSGPYFELFNARVLAGRVIHEQDLRARQQVAVVSERFSTRVFGSADAAMGSPVSVAGQRLSIVGVVLSPVRSGIAADIWVPAHVLPVETLFGRLADGVTVAQATSEVATRYGRVGTVDPRLLMVQQGLASPLARPAYLDLLWVVGVALVVSLIASVSFGLLLFARMASTQSDMAVRVALGATTRDLTRLLASEVLILAVAATVVAVNLGRVLANFVLDEFAAGSGWRVAADTSGDWRIFLFVGGMTLAVALAVVARLGWSIARVEALGAMVATGGLGGGTIRTSGTSAKLVLAQSAATAALLLLAAVITRSALPGRTFTHGLPVDRTAIAWLDRTGSRAGLDSRARTVLLTVAGTEGLRASALVSSLPAGAAGAPVNRVTLADDTRHWAAVHYVTAGAFEALGLTVMRGRTFDEAEADALAPVAVVGHAAAARLWPGLDPIGRHVRVSHEGQTFEAAVIGEVSDALIGPDDSRDEPRDLYLAFGLRPDWAAVGLLARSDRGAEALANQLATSMQRALPDVGFRSIRPLADDLHERSAPPQFIPRILWTLGGLVFVVAIGGLYGLMAYLATIRRREIGIRRALGATSGALCRMLARENSRVLMAGVTLGIIGGLLIGALFDRPNMNLQLLDPLVVAIVGVTLYAAGLLGTIVPYVQAMREATIRLRD